MGTGVTTPCFAAAASISWSLPAWNKPLDLMELFTVPVLDPVANNLLPLQDTLAAAGLLAEVKEVPALLQVQRPQVVLKCAPCKVQLHADDKGRPGSSEVQDGHLGLGPLLRVLVAVKALPDLVFIDVTEGGHLAPRPCCEAAVEPAALLARIPDGEGRPVWQSPFFQEADTVGPDGALEDGVCGCTGMVAVEEEALVHPDNTTALPEVVVEEQQVLRHALPTLVELAHVRKPCSRAEPGGHDHSWAIGGKNLGKKLIGC